MSGIRSVVKPLISCLSAATALRGGVYYVAPGGTATWEESRSIASPCALSTANREAAGGDTVELGEGTYTDAYIKPAHSGTSADPVVFRAGDNDSVTITDTRYGILIDGQSHITVTGITFVNLGHSLYIMNNAHHNTVGHCTFDRARDSTTWGGSKIYHVAQYNRVHHCSFSRWGYANDDGHAGALFDVGNEFEEHDSSYYNLIEDNTFFYGGHHCLAAWSKYCVFRNNYLHHERSPTEGFGYRCAITHGKAVDRNLFEGNRFAFAHEASGMSLRSSNNIFRFNAFYRNGLGGIQCVSMKGYTPAHYNHIYHNVFFDNGHAADYGGFSGGVYFCDWGRGDPVGNVVKNNIFYRNKGGAITTDGVTTGQIVDGNWDTGDPLFVDDETAFGPFDPHLPDFRLQQQSPCIDNGTFLTRITADDGSGRRLRVEDAGYFTTGWGGIDGDRIRLEGSGQRARVIEIDYSTNTITVDSDLSWSKNTGVALAYAGAAPDQGAHERGLEPDPVTWGRVREPAAVKSHGACLILPGRDVACRRRRVVEGRMFDIRGQRIRAGSIMADGIVVVRMRSGLHPGR